MLTKTEILETMNEICHTTSCQNCMFHLNQETTAQNGKLSACLRNLINDSQPQKCVTCGRNL